MAKTRCYDYVIRDQTAWGIINLGTPGYVDQKPGPQGVHCTAMQCHALQWDFSNSRSC